MELVLCYPVASIGGAQKLLVTLVTALHESGMLRKVILFDFEGGYLSAELQKSKVSLDIYDISCINKFPFSENAVLVTAFSEIKYLAQYEITPSLKFVLWSIHPFGFSIFARLGPLYRNLPFEYQWKVARYIEPSRFEALNRLIKLSCIGGAFWIMDESNYNFGNKIGFDLSHSKMVPIGIDFYKKNLALKSNFVRCKSSNFGWIGRLDKDKYLSLEHSLRLANDVASLLGKKVDFYIIGDGNAMNSVLKLKFPFLHIKCKGFLSGSTLNKFLLENTRIVFAMGTSALEAAALEISTIIVDCLTHRVKNIYSNVHLMSQDSPYYLGDIIQLERKSNINREDIYELFISDDISDYATKCRLIAKTYFDMSTNLEHFDHETVSLLPSWEEIRGDIEYLFSSK
jgi:glycosyltransferase involved in cell wall biosynthesis